MDGYGHVDNRNDEGENAQYGDHRRNGPFNRIGHFAYLHGLIGLAGVPPA